MYKLLPSTDHDTKYILVNQDTMNTIAGFETKTLGLYMEALFNKPRLGEILIEASNLTFFDRQQMLDSISVESKKKDPSFIRIAAIALKALT